MEAGKGNPSPHSASAVLTFRFGGAKAAPVPKAIAR